MPIYLKYEFLIHKVKVKIMLVVEKGKFVKVHYTGKLEDNQVFDTSQNCHPLEVKIGNQQLIKGFEEALIGMKINEKKSFSLSPEEAYGERDESLEKTFERRDLPPNLEAEIGQVFALRDEANKQVRATVKHVDSEKIIMDLNHPLAGKALTFEVEVLEINDEPSAAPPSCGSGGCSSC
jgi:peptidylprolyl isomerase